MMGQEIFAGKMAPMMYKAKVAKVIATGSMGIEVGAKTHMRAVTMEMMQIF